MVAMAIGAQVSRVHQVILGTRLALGWPLDSRRGCCAQTYGEPSRRLPMEGEQVADEQANEPDCLAQRSRGRPAGEIECVIDLITGQS